MRARVRLQLAGVALAVLALGACASAGVPPGGPERHTAPMIVRMRPDTNSVNVRGDEMVVEFDEVIAEQPVGAPRLGDLVLISPRDGAPFVDWHRGSIAIHQRHGWRRNTTYTVTLLPGISDLHGNVRNRTVAVTFSTGPAVIRTAVAGTLFDWVTGAPVTTGIVEARPVSDSNLVFVAATDSLGAFRLAGLPPAQYRVRGIVDQNRNRGLDPGEAFDSTRVNVADSLRVELLAFVHDTVGPRISTVTPVDSVTLRVGFLTPLDPRVPVTAAQFAVLASDSTRLPIMKVAATLPDTGASGSAAAPPTAATQVPIPLSPQRATTSTRPHPSVALLVRDVAITLGTRLRSGSTYRVRAIGVRGPTGLVATSDRTVTVPNFTTASDTLLRPRTAPPRYQPPPPTPQPARPVP